MGGSVVSRAAPERDLFGPVRREARREAADEAALPQADAPGSPRGGATVPATVSEPTRTR